MNRRTFLQDASLLAAGSFIGLPTAQAAPPYPVVRPAVGQRRFRSRAVEAAITEFGQKV